MLQTTLLQIFKAGGQLTDHILLAKIFGYQPNLNVH